MILVFYSELSDDVIASTAAGSSGSSVTQPTQDPSYNH